MSYLSQWTDPNNEESNLQSGDVLYEASIRRAWMQVLQWLGADHVHRGRDGDGPLWPIAVTLDHKIWSFYNPLSWSNPKFTNDEASHWVMMDEDITASEEDP